jgi:hypothetical protein
MDNQRVSRGYKEGLLESLNEKERRVLYLLVQGNNIPQIAEILGFSPSSIRAWQTEIYKKFGIKDLDDYEKRKNLLNDYGELVRKFESVEEFVKWNRPKPEPEQVPESVTSILDRAETVPAPPPSPISTITTRNVAIVVGVGVIMVVLAIIFFGSNHPADQPEESQASELPAPLLNSPTSTFFPSTTLTPTKSPKPTNTKVPTKTPPPTISPTPYQLPFIDEFTAGIRSEWKITGDTPLVVDNSLTSMGTTTFSLGVGEVSFRDYIVDFKALKWGGSDHFIGVRALDNNNMIAIKEGGSLDSGFYVYIVRNGNWTQVANTAMADRSSPIYFVINVKGNILLVTIGGVRGSTTKEIHLSEPFTQNGGVIYKIEGTSHNYETDVVDYIRILPNP